MFWLPCGVPLCILSALCAQRTMGASRHPGLPAPSHQRRGTEIMHSSGASCRERAASWLPQVHPLSHLASQNYSALANVG